MNQETEESYGASRLFVVNLSFDVTPLGIMYVQFTTFFCVNSVVLMVLMTCTDF